MAFTLPPPLPHLCYKLEGKRGDVSGPSVCCSGRPEWISIALDLYQDESALDVQLGDSLTPRPVPVDGSFHELLEF